MLPESLEDDETLVETARALANRLETFEHHEDGEVFYFDITLGSYIIWCKPRNTCLISLSDAGIDEAHIRMRYPTLDWTFARTTDLTRPLLFVEWRGNHLLIDGWHRLAHACLKGVDELPAYVLNEAERDIILCQGGNDDPDD